MSPEQLAAAYFDAWQADDVEAVRPLLADGVDFVGALGTAQGVAECVAGLRGMFGMTESVRVVRRWIDGDDVITWFELQINGATMAVVNWSHVTAGRIDRIRVTFDPRPITG